MRSCESAATRLTRPNFSPVGQFEEIADHFVGVYARAELCHCCCPSQFRVTKHPIRSVLQCFTDLQCPALMAVRIPCLAMRSRTCRAESSHELCRWRRCPAWLAMTVRPDSEAYTLTSVAHRALVLVSATRKYLAALSTVRQGRWAPGIIRRRSPVHAPAGTSAHAATPRRSVPRSPSTGRCSPRNSAPVARLHGHGVWVRRDIVRQHQDRRLAPPHEIARYGEHEVGVGAIHPVQERIHHLPS